MSGGISSASTSPASLIFPRNHLCLSINCRVPVTISPYTPAVSRSDARVPAHALIKKFQSLLNQRRWAVVFDRLTFCFEAYCIFFVCFSTITLKQKNPMAPWFRMYVQTFAPNATLSFIWNSISSCRIKSSSLVWNGSLLLLNAHAHHTICLLFPARCQRLNGEQRRTV